MDNQVDEIKSKVDIVPIINDRVTLTKAGKNYKGLCPFHGEKTPSFMVSSELQIFKCFGCGESGDVFSFLEKYEGMDFYEALKYLADRVGIKLKPRVDDFRNEKQILYETNLLIAKLYNYLLLKHPVGKSALDYVQKARGLNLATIRQFDLGFSPNDSRLVTNYLVRQKKITKDTLIKVGLAYARGSEMVDRFRGRVIFPLLDHRKNVLGFAGRILPEYDNGELAKYINTPETSIYHKSHTLYGLAETRSDIKRQGVAVIVEGELDMISSWQAGITNTVAIKGSALTEDQSRLLGRFCSKVVLALDADIAGNLAARRGIAIAEGQGLEVRVARLHGFKDPDEAARKEPEKLKKALQDAVGVWDFIIDSIFAKYDRTTGEGKLGVSKDVTPVLSEIQDKIVQAHYIAQVANRLGVPIDAVLAEVQKKTKPETSESTGVSREVRNKTRHELLEERILSNLFLSDPMKGKDLKIKHLLSTPLYLKVWDFFLKNKDKFYIKNKFDLKKFSQEIPDELQSVFNDLIFIDSFVQETGVVQTDKELTDLVHELLMVNSKEKMAELSSKIKIYEQRGNSKDLQKANKEFSLMSKTVTDLGKN